MNKRRIYTDAYWMIIGAMLMYGYLESISVLIGSIGLALVLVIYSLNPDMDVWRHRGGE